MGLSGVIDVGMEVRGDFAVYEPDHSLAVGRHVVLVGDDDDGLPVLVKLVEDLENLPGRR